MIDENLNYSRKTPKGFREIVGFFFAKWWDEPFTVDMLNRTHCRDCEYILGTDNDDQLHVDYYIRKDGKQYTVDSKTYTHNFKFIGENVAKNGLYADILTIAEHAMKSYTHYFSTVYYDKVYMIPHIEFINENHIHTCMITNKSKGQNNRQQDLYHYKMSDIKKIPSVFTCDIPKEMQKCYDEAYKIYLEHKNSVYWFMRNHRGEDTTQFMYSECEEMRKALIPIIRKFNNIYDELPKIDINNTLFEIKSLLD